MENLLRSHFELLSKSLKAYRQRYPEEEEMICSFEKLLGSRDCCFQSAHPAHFTASAWIVDPQKTRALLLHHPKLLRWLQPGGHLEKGELPWQAAQREVREEVGFEIDFAEKTNELVLPFDIDCHQIPAKGSGQEHWHYDFRFLSYVSNRLPQGEGEGLDFRWFNLELIRKPMFEASVEKMALKTALLETKKGSIF